MFTMASCPYCQKAHRYMRELFEKRPEYKDIELTVVDETQQPEIANKYDYYFVPTYYVEDVKVHEGAASPEDVEYVFRTAYGK
jgi:glutaredoxin